MVRDVAMRWNSTAVLLERALQLRDGLNLLVIAEQHNRPLSVCLKRFQLMKQEWELLKKLFLLLEVSTLISLISVLRLWTDFRGFFTILFNLIFTFYRTEIERLRRTATSSRDFAKFIDRFRTISDA